MQPQVFPRTSCKGWSLEKLVDSGLKPVPRISSLDHENLKRSIEEHERSGIPLIIEDVHKHPKWSGSAQLFSPEWLLENGPTDIDVRNVHNSEDTTIPLSTFIEHARTIEPYTCPGEEVRFYGKDAPCPEQWNQWLHKAGAIPQSLLPDSPYNYLNKLEGQVEHLMCYLGTGDTYTPSHKDLCASSGHNLMVYTETSGSSFWFMTESEDSRNATDFFASLKQTLEHETHVLTYTEAAKAPIRFYVAEQKLGDLVLVPPRSCHQVVNHGGITIKVSWSRMTFKGLQMALYHELPLYRRVCRRETYKVKAIIFHTIVKLTADLRSNGHEKHVKHLATFLHLFDDILRDEYSPHHKAMSTLPSPSSNLSCDFCGADIFHGFLHCGKCVNEPSENIVDGFLLCPGCFVEGRTCKCRDLRPVQCQAFENLLDARRKAQDALELFYSENRDFRAVKLKPEGELLSLASRNGIFSGCGLLLARRSQMQEETRICSPGRKGESSHYALSERVVYCKDCHRSLCYLHLLHCKLHALQSLHGRNADHHRLHQEARERYDDTLGAYTEAERKGTKPDFATQLSNLARAFTTCKPFNPKFCQGGWYDKKILLIETPEDVTIEPDASQDPSTSQLAATSDHDVDDRNYQGHRRKRKTFVLDCVFVGELKAAKRPKGPSTTSQPDTPTSRSKRGKSRNGSRPASSSMTDDKNSSISPKSGESTAINGNEMPQTNSEKGKERDLAVHGDIPDFEKPISENLASVPTASSSISPTPSDSLNDIQRQLYQCLQETAYLRRNMDDQIAVDASGPAQRSPSSGIASDNNVRSLLLIHIQDQLSVVARGLKMLRHSNPQDPSPASVAPGYTATQERNYDDTIRSDLSTFHINGLVPGLQTPTNSSPDPQSKALDNEIFWQIPPRGPSEHVETSISAASCNPRKDVTVDPAGSESTSRPRSQSYVDVVGDNQDDEFDELALF